MHIFIKNYWSVMLPCERFLVAIITCTYLRIAVSIAFKLGIAICQPAFHYYRLNKF